jgi:type IV pilus assembly protein PilA
MFCTSCGTANPESGRFCAKCGAALAGTGGPPAAPPGAAPVSLGAPPSYAGGVPQPFMGPPQTSGKALASLICGFFFWIFPASVAAIILGHLSLSEIRKAAGRLKGRGMAVTGLVLGYGGVLLLPVIFLLGAAIIIPNLLRSRMAANETSAVGSVRTLNGAATQYAVTYGNGFPPNLDVLGTAESGSATCDHAQLLNGPLASGQRNGYVFVYFLEPSSGGPPAISPAATANGCTMPGGSAFEIHADPVTRGTTGQRSFYTDQTGIIRWEAAKPATADSDALE